MAVGYGQPLEQLIEAAPIKGRKLALLAMQWFDRNAGVAAARSLTEAANRLPHRWTESSGSEAQSDGHQAPPPGMTQTEFVQKLFARGLYSSRYMVLALEGLSVNVEREAKSPAPDGAVGPATWALGRALRIAKEAADSQGVREPLRALMLMVASGSTSVHRRLLNELGATLDDWCALHRYPSYACSHQPPSNSALGASRLSPLSAILEAHRRDFLGSTVISRFPEIRSLAPRPGGA